MIVNCNIPLNRLVTWDKMFLESCLKTGGFNPWGVRKNLKQSYAILDSVRHLGPRRRAELDELTDLDAHYDEFLEWEKMIMRLVEQAEEEEE